MKTFFRFTPRRFLLFFTLCAVTFATPAFLYHQGFRVGLSKSLPYHVYRVSPYVSADNLSVHDYVAVDATRVFSPMIEVGIERHFIHPRIYLGKQIGAVSGDVVEIISHDLFINGQKTDIYVSFQDGQGRPLSSAPSPVTLDADSFWLISAPHGGFDSRYFGPVKRSAIMYRVFPLF